MVCRLTGPPSVGFLAATGLVLTTIGGCGVESWRNADLQFDIESALPDAAEQLRVCIDGAGVREQGAAEAGRFAVPGVPMDRPAVVTVQTVGLLGEDTGGVDAQNSVVIGQAGPKTLETTSPYVRASYTEYTAGEGPSLCEVAGSFATDEEESWLLAVRFSD